MIPVIDLLESNGHGTASHVGQQIADACRDLGVFQVVGHGINSALIDTVTRTSHEFFALPDSDKQRHASPSGNPYLGWATTEMHRADGPVRFHEQFEVSWFDGSDDLRHAGYGEDWAALAESNTWPTTPSDFEPSWRRYFAAMDSLGTRLLRFMLPNLHVPENWPTQLFSQPASFLAGNYYLPSNDGPAIRLEAHTDIGSLTILQQDDGPGGLQVRGPDDIWHDVPALPGALVVNLGDLFTIWTNGRWTVPEHRVLASPPGSQSPRMSIAYFQNPNLDAVIEPLPALVAPAQQSSPVGPVVAGKWIQRRMAEYQEL